MVTEELYNPVMRAHAPTYAVIQFFRHHPSPRHEKRKKTADFCGYPCAIRYGRHTGGYPGI